MTFEEILSKVRTIAEKADVSGAGFLAAQINITGDNGGVFYVEVKDGRINVEPYPYNDRNCEITISADNLSKLIEGKLDPVAAFTFGKLKVNGDVGKALEFAKIVKK
ncbi:MAG: SCP2 sterol-binding domain-containing protein [Ruminiclostridium sp.]|nr:SCP2 sterol-binding domain-containing protein [Ruminiclostridium sp.]